MVYAVPPLISVSVFMKKGPADQSIAENVPIMGVPAPIAMDTNPFSFVKTVCLSA
jgi:hypothetical protein